VGERALIRPVLPYCPIDPSYCSAGPVKADNSLVAKQGNASGAPAYRRFSEPAYRGRFVSRYDRLRPEPPVDLVELLCALAPARPPSLVVDLGSGTGISTVAWAAHAEHVIGVDVNPEMLGAARQALNVEYRHAAAHDTRLPDDCADVSTCAQSFHWMDPESTIAEIARILRPEGIFAAYDYDWPPLVHWEIDDAFLAVIEASGIDPSRPEKAQHLERLQASGCFRWVREFFMHTREEREAARIAQLPLAFGSVARRLNEGASEEDLGLDRLRRTVEQRLGARDATLWWSYRVRIAAK
jgi:ubiquinone/menaquinone biosynthesis C-methylase UbiE